MISAIENVSHLRFVRWARIMGSNPYLTVTSCNVTCVRSMCIVITYCQLSGEGGVGENIYCDGKTLKYGKNKAQGCPFCSGRRAFAGETDIFSTNPELGCMGRIRLWLDSILFMNILIK